MCECSYTRTWLLIYLLLGPRQRGRYNDSQRTGRFVVTTPVGERDFFCLYTRSDTLWGPPIFLLNGCGWPFLESKSCRSVILTTQLHLARSWGMSGAVPLFYLFILFIAPKILQVHIGLQIVPKTNLQQCHFHYACKCV